MNPSRSFVILLLAGTLFLNMAPAVSAGGCSDGQPPSCGATCPIGFTCTAVTVAGCVVAGCQETCECVPDRTGACCYLNLDLAVAGGGPVQCTEISEVGCDENLNGVYQGDDTICEQDTCDGLPPCEQATPPDCEGLCSVGGECEPFIPPSGGPMCGCFSDPPTGACCLDDGSCGDDVLEFICGEVSGTYQGDGTSCAPDLCPIPSCGDASAPACFGTCSEGFECREPLVAGGNGCNCFPLTGACCFPGSTDCNIATASDCQGAGGNFRGDGVLCQDTTCAPSRVSSTQKGSVLIYSKIEVKWDASGDVIQDTFLDITNDYPDGVIVQAWFINGDTEIEQLLDTNGGVIRDYEPGWNTADCRFELTANQPHYWSAANGSDKCQRFTVLDDDGPGRPDAETGGHILRGYAIFHAVIVDVNIWQDLKWNHLKGDAVIVNYANGTAWEYNAWAFQNRAALVGHGEPSGSFAELRLDGIEYDAPFASLILDFYASGSTVLSGGDQTVMVDTDLTLHAVRADLRQDGCGPVLTKVEAEIWNEYESKFSGTRRCICCWDQTMLSDWVRSAIVPNHFLREALRTNKGKARLDGVESNECDYAELCGPTAAMKRRVECFERILNPKVAGIIDGDTAFDISEDAAILGLATKFIAFSPSGNQDTAGMNLVGAGTEPAYIQYDIQIGPEEVRNGKNVRMRTDAARTTDR